MCWAPMLLAPLVPLLLVVGWLVLRRLRVPFSALVMLTLLAIVVTALRLGWSGLALARVPMENDPVNLAAYVLGGGVAGWVTARVLPGLRRSATVRAALAVAVVAGALAPAAPIVQQRSLLAQLDASGRDYFRPSLPGMTARFNGTNPAYPYLMLEKAAGTADVGVLADIPADGSPCAPFVRFELGRCTPDGTGATVPQEQSSSTLVVEMHGRTRLLAYFPADLLDAEAVRAALRSAPRVSAEELVTLVG